MNVKVRAMRLIGKRNRAGGWLRRWMTREGDELQRKKGKAMCRRELEGTTGSSIYHLIACWGQPAGSSMGLAAQARWHSG